MMKIQPPAELTTLQLRSEIEQMMGYLKKTESGLPGCPNGIKEKDKREWMYVYYIPEDGRLVYRAYNESGHSGAISDRVEILINHPEIEKEWLVKLHGSLQVSAWQQAENEALYETTRVQFIYQMGFPPR